MKTVQEVASRFGTDFKVKSSDKVEVRLTPQGEAQLAATYARLHSKSPEEAAMDISVLYRYDGPYVMILSQLVALLGSGEAKKLLDPRSLRAVGQQKLHDHYSRR